MPEKCFSHFGLNGDTQIYKKTTKGSLYWKLNKVQTWKGFSPVWTNWCLFSLELSTNAFPHSAQTWTRGPCVCRCFLMAELSRNILLQPCQVKHTYRYSLLLLSHSLKNIGELDHIGGFLSRRELSYTYLVRTGNCSGNIISWLAGLNSGIKTLTGLGCLKGNPGMLKLSRLNVSWNYLGYILLTQFFLKR